jgi:hypothetical protein
MPIGDALRSVASMGCDMTKPMEIDFFVDAWDCYCTKLMVPTYEAICEAQSELDE